MLDTRPFGGKIQPKIKPAIKTPSSITGQNGTKQGPLEDDGAIKLSNGLDLSIHEDD